MHISEARYNASISSPIVVGSASTFRFRVSSLIRGGTRLHLLKTMTMIRGGFKCELS